jgi:hypothetical protein
MKHTYHLDYHNIDLFVTFQDGEPYEICTFKGTKNGRDVYEDVEFLFTDGVVAEIYQRASEALRDDDPTFAKAWKEALYDFGG